jgi:hypothetical protein
VADTAANFFLSPLAIASESSDNRNRAAPGHRKYLAAFYGQEFRCGLSVYEWLPRLPIGGQFAQLDVWIGGHEVAPSDRHCASASFHSCA